MKLYEVVRWGNDSEDVHTGGPNGPDTCYLVRATSMESAVRLAEERLRWLPPSDLVFPYASAVYELGEDSGASVDARVLRGPYIEHAYCHGWRSWHRHELHEPWEESEPKLR